MRSWFADPDRRLKLGIVVLAASVVMLVVGLVAVFFAMDDDGAELPNQGSIEQIIGESPAPRPAVAEKPAGPPPPRPVRLAIRRLYIDAPVITMGLDADRSPQVPDRPDQVAWYDFSAAPGQSSNAVLSGHVDWQTRSGMPIPGVFYRLREMEIGDELNVTLENGAQLKYRVTGNVATAYDDPNIVKAMRATAKDVVTLITCGGVWVRNPRQQFGGSYSHRVVVRAERVIDSVSGGVGGG